jgi:RNA polymerase sigma factor (sigma-70 family)
MLSAVLSYLHRLPGAGSGDEPDAELLRRFHVSRDQGAFAALVTRHGPMVWGVCKRLLRRQQDAEDAFQATFLILVRKSYSLLRPDLLGPWLHAVALRTASRLRAQVSRRQDHEHAIVEEPAMESTTDLVWRDLRPLLDEEVGRLPAKYRAAIILCHLEGLSNEAAARRLGCPKGTVLSRLSRGRELLRSRLARRGLGLSAVALAGALAAEDCAGAVPAALSLSTIQLGLEFAVGAASGTVPVQAVALAEGVLKSMFHTQMKFTVAVALALGVAAAGMGVLAFGPGPGQSAVAAQDAAAKPAPAPANKPEGEQNKKLGDAKRDSSVKLGDAKRDSSVDSRGRRQKLENRLEKYSSDVGPTLADHLDYMEGNALGEGLNFEINEQAFAEAGLNNVRQTEVSKTPWSLKEVTLATVLRRLLGHIPVPTVVLIRKDTVEITTVAAARAELGLPESRPLLPLVWEEIDGLTLPKALQQLSKASGMNVILDPRALTEDLANLKITVQFANAPVDSAVRILANMADLQMVQMDNILYVTTPKRASQLQFELKRTIDRATDNEMPAPQSPQQSGKTPGGSM